MDSKNIVFTSIHFYDLENFIFYSLCFYLKKIVFKINILIMTIYLEE